ncbi:MAG: hypothetical protein COA83_07690 [Methylophaga sp.]|nr:MAG: hypothetical protein COA83_07690 [Methylophaga sp.]
MAYQDISYKDKLEILLAHKTIKTSAKLSHILNVSRNSIINWREDDSKINTENRDAIDFWYCKVIGLDSLNNIDIEPTALAQNFFFEPNLKDVLARRLSFGSLEVEVSVDEDKFKQVIDNIIPNDMNTQAVLEVVGVANATRRMMDAISENSFVIDSRQIRDWHYNLMQGIRRDAGQYSTNIRIIPDAEVATTEPEDIEAEIEYWVSKYRGIESVMDIAKAHAHFESIHPFGDGNGRVGRLIMTAQYLQAGLIPPEINGSNKAMYYATLEHAQISGNVKPLAVFLCEQSKKLSESHLNKPSGAQLFKE